MRISAEHTTFLINSFDEALSLAEKTPSGEEKLYYFSYVFGSINRIINIDFDPCLLFIHQELQSVHTSIQGRLNRPVTPSNVNIASTPDEIFEALFRHVKRLREAIIENNESNVYMILQDLSQVGYAATGNGFYLYQTGKLKL